MSNKTRKRLWPVSLVMAVAIVGVLAAFLMVASSPSSTEAHDPDPPVYGDAHCSDNALLRDLHDATAEGHTCDNPPQEPANNAPAAGAPIDGSTIGIGGTVMVTSTITDEDGADDIASWAWTSSDESVATVMADAADMSMATVTGVANGTATITVTATDAAGESASETVTIAVYTPAPSTIKSSSSTGGSSVKLTLTMTDPGALSAGSSVVLYLEDDFQVGDIDMSKVYFVGKTTGRVYVTDAIVVSDDDHFKGDDDWDIQVFVPDMNPGNDTGFDAWSAANAMGLQLVLDKSGVKNPTEAKNGGYKAGYTVLAPGASVAKFDATNAAYIALDNLAVNAKISLSDEDTGRGKEITITGTGFNNGTGAEVFVFVSNDKPANCEALVGDASTGKLATKDSKNMTEERHSLGTALVGSDDKFVVTYTVHQDEFNAGAVNHICAVDSEADAPRFSSDVDTFDLEGSLTVSPASASYGDEITLKPRDTGAVSQISIGPRHVWNADGSCPTDPRKICMAQGAIKKDDSDYVFDLPGGLDAQAQIAVNTADGVKRVYLGVVASSLKLSQTEVAPNASIIISGSGFTEDAKIYTNMITIDDTPMDVDDAGTQTDSEGRYVQTTSNGAFTATVRIWTASDSVSNPALDDDTYTIKVVDSGSFEGEAEITILEPTVSVSPDTASPRDFIVISGENWPITTAAKDNRVNINVDGRDRSADIDGSGRFRYEYQLSSTIGIGDEHDVTVTYDGKAGGDIEEEATFSVTEATLGLEPGAAAPGQTITVSVNGMPPYALIEHVKIDGKNRLGSRNINTDREGDASVADILVPYLDPGYYPVEVMVGDETRVAQLEVLAEAVVPGVAAMLPGAVSDLGDNLEAIFHFNNTNKEWTFFDPRPEFADLNTLTELNGGQPYWVLVGESQDDVDWNGRLDSFTCAAGDCWNLKIW